MSSSSESLLPFSISNLHHHFGKFTLSPTIAPADVLILCLFTTFFLYLRHFTTKHIFHPLSLRLGLLSLSKRTRFSEQSYTGLYAGFTGLFGLWIMYHSPLWYFRTRPFYENYPHQTLSPIFKAYYLMQAGYWLHQVIVLVFGIEKPRKDIRELTAHHIVTFVLIVLSYRFHFTQMGLAVFISHDIPEFFLAASKCLHYIDSPITVPWFAATILNWIYMRHYLNWYIMLSVMTEFRTVGPYKLDWEKEQYKCWISNVICGVLLVFLQGLNLFWLGALARMAGRWCRTGEKVDDRSEDEEEEEVKRE